MQMAADAIARAWYEGKYLAATLLLSRSSLSPTELCRLISESAFITAPSFFRKTGEAFEYCLAMECFLLHIKKLILDNRTDRDVVNSVFSIISTKLNLRMALFSDHDLSIIHKSRAVLIEEYCKANSLFCLELDSSDNLKAALIVNNLSDNLETTTALSQLLALSNDYRKYICFYEKTDTALDHFCVSNDIGLVQLSGNCSKDLEFLRKLGLRIAIYGSDLTCFIRPITVLAASRIAKIQIANMATACSTMLTNIDNFIMGSAYKPDSCYELYSEDIIGLNGLGYRGIESKDLIDRKQIYKRKERLLFSHKETILATGSSFYKTTPEALDLWFKIMSKVSNAVLRIAPFNRRVTPENETRFIDFIRSKAAEYAIDPSRITIVKLDGTRMAFLRYLAVSDLLLDSPMFSSGNATLDSFQVCTPIISLEGYSFRSKLSAGSQSVFGKRNQIFKTEVSFRDRIIELCSEKEALAAEMHQYYSRYDERMVSGFKNMEGIHL